ncbi:MAG: hypothetical protein ACTSX6_10445 [Candidatus Heimdallarchaeaceae archaeon]
MSENFEAQLTIKDRINFPYILANQILTFQRSLLKVEASEQEILESIEGLIHLIPEEWKDDEFRKDLENARIATVKDNRPRWCGFPLDEEICKLRGIEPFTKEERRDPYKLLQAVINLLHRRGMLSKKLWTEVFTGEKVKKEGISERDLLGDVPS